MTTYQYIYAVVEHPLEKPLCYFKYALDAEDYVLKHGFQVMEIQVVERP